MVIARPQLYNLGHIYAKTTTPHFLDTRKLTKRSLCITPSICNAIKRHSNFKSQHSLLSTQIKHREEIDEKSSSPTFGNKPQNNPSWYSEDEKRRAKNISHLLSMAWRDYKSTWEGFNENLKKKSKPDEKEENDEENDNSNSYKIYSDRLAEKQKEIKGNVDRNLGVLREEGASLLSFVKGLTGINNKRDLKVFAMEQLKLANECVAEFMKGYRHGRDDEFDRVTTQYFKDLEINDIFDDTQTKGDEGKNAIPNDEISTEIKRKRRRKSKLVTRKTT